MTLSYLKTGIAAAVAAASPRRAGGGAERAVHPDPVLSHGRLCRERRALRQRRRGLLQPRQRARRRHQRRQAHLRGVRDRLRHRQGRGVLRAPQGQGPDRRRLLQPAVDRHHLRADREGPRPTRSRSSPWATAAPTPRTARCSPGTSRCSAPTGRQPTSPSSTSPRRSAASTSSRARRSASSFTTAPTARSRSRRCRRWPQKHGFEFTPIPVTHPGVEQKSQWLTIRQNRPDYVLLWGWGVMNGAAIKEAAAVAYPRDKMIGVWWSGAEPDVTPAGDQSVGYKALMLQHGAQKAHGARRHREARLRQGQGHRREGQGRRGALQPRPGQRHARRRGDPHGAEEVRQQAADRRAGALGLREPQSRRRPHQGAGLRGHDEADQDHVRRPRRRARRPRPAVGRQGSGRSSPTGTRPTRRSPSRWSRKCRPKYAAEKKITPRDCSKES